MSFDVEKEARNATVQLNIPDDAWNRKVLMDFLTRCRDATEEECMEAVEERFRREEKKLENRHMLFGNRIRSTARKLKMPLIRDSADLAAARLLAISAIHERRRRRREEPTDG